MRRPARSLLTWFLTVMIGGMSFLGESLHDLLGFHHVPVVSDSCLLAFDPGRGSRQGNVSYIGEAPQRERCHDSATCPICQYLAQGRLVGEQVKVVSVAVSVPHPSTVIPLFVPSPLLQPFQARAPPAV